MADEPKHPPGFHASPYSRPGYRWGILFLLMLTYAVHSMDRFMPAILVEPVRHEFHLNDATLGLLTGTLYAFGFGLAALPTGYMADRLNRRNFLSAILVLWSLCTALGGISRTFVQLIGTRFVVGAAETGAAPVILPLIADVFPANRRAFATGVLYFGVPLGALVASAGGGWLAAEHGWRAALLLAGIPGVVLAGLVLLFVREPGRGVVDGERHEGAAPVIDVARHLFRHPELLITILAGCLIGLTAITIGVWQSSFFIRVHGLTLKQTGLVMGLGVGLASLGSPLLSGWLADRLGRGEPVKPILIAIAASAGAGLSGLVWVFAPPLALSIAGLMGQMFLSQGYAALLYPVVMTRTPAPMRGSVMSFIQFMSVVIGFGIGPRLAGQLSDFYGGGTAIRYAMALTLGINILVVLLLAIAALIFRGGRNGPSAEPAALPA